MSGEQQFHFTIGPVQGFVAQARRTRDFWAGSFILSWLSAVAMEAVRQQGGTIRFPAPDEAFMQALLGKAAGGDGPRQGTVPNRFMAEVGEGFDPEEVTGSVREAWRALAEAVWAGDDLDAVAGSETRAIWERQVAGLWEMSWAVTDGPDSAVLDRRKNWRSHMPPAEPGTKCHVMDGWQELSGAERPGQEGEGFWTALRNSGASGIATDLRDNERLCAPAYIKRRFTRHFAGLDAAMPGGWRLKGWHLDDGVPSVAYMAAAHWLAQTVAAGPAEQLWQFHDAAYALTGSYGEWDSNVQCIREAVQAQGGHRKWESLDGDVLFEEFLDNANIYPDQEQAGRVREALDHLKKEAGTGSPTPFYALLLMDGDSLGVHMGDPDKQPEITKGLKKFTDDVPALVRKHNGFPIYAGGDDVLALLPLEDALPCAAELRGKYLAAFADSGIPTTLSGAVLYAHVRTPLTQLIQRAHPLLDDVAKAARGRDALAVEVRKPGGVAATWAMPWEKALADDGEQVELDRLARAMGDAEGNAPFASRFFYALRERFDLLNPGDSQDTEGARAVFGAGLAEELIAAEYRGAAEAAGGRPVSLQEARDVVGPLLAQSRPKVRKTDAEGRFRDWTTEPRLQPDAGLIVRFLAQKGAEA